MAAFLENTADYIIRHFGDNLDKVCIVLPNRRAGLFLKKYLGGKISKTSWAPGILSIEDFMSQLSGLSLCDPIQVLFELYLVHRETEGEKAEPFEEFIQWGQQLINDFREIDEYLADPEELFSYLDETKALTVWNLNTKPLTDFEKQYLHFFHSLGLYYNKLREQLLGSGRAYPGLIFRRTAENIEKLVAGIKWNRIVFAGFNALTRAEEVVIDHLVSEGKADLLWDSDPYYRDDEKQEAGFFLRKWTRKWQNLPFQWNEDHFSKDSKEIKIIGVPLNVGQAKICSEILEELKTSGAAGENIAVVMMDEQLLFPLLNSLPPETEQLNITMGMPLRQTPLFSLVDSLFRMQENLRRFSSDPDSPVFYYKDVLFILNHPYLKRLAEHATSGNLFAMEERINGIAQSGIVFPRREQITGAKDELFSTHLEFLDVFFTGWKDPEDAIRCLKEMITRFRDNLTGTKGEEDSGYNKVELEILYAFSKLVFQLSSWISRYHAVTSVQTLYRLFRQLSSSISLPFYGEPLRGIQIMGMLETRTLDFDNVILLSANEDLLPGGKSVQSFLPFEIKREFGLPTWRHKNSIYAYHFYRLLQNTRKTWILYNTEADELGGGDKSRFIKQIQHELAGYNPGIHISEYLLATPPAGQAGIMTETIGKSPDILRLIDEKAAKGFSATSLSNYIRCPLKFYLNDIAGLKEEKETEETIDVMVLGQATHKALEILYRKRMGNPLSGDDLDAMIHESPAAVDEAFRKVYKGPDVRYGKNLLIVRVAGILVKRLLEREKQDIEKYGEKGWPLVIKYLELPVESYIEVPDAGGTKKVKLKGFIDRVDRIGDRWRILDYKTGSVEPADLVLKNWEDLRADESRSKCLQLLLYAMLLLERPQDRDKITGVNPGIVPLKKISSGLLELKLPGSDGHNNNFLNPGSLSDFRNVLVTILQEIFNPSVPFTATEEISRCRHCEFISFCGR